VPYQVGVWKKKKLNIREKFAEEYIRLEKVGSGVVVYSISYKLCARSVKNESIMERLSVHPSP